ncbi:MAG: DUF503 domain-containing protein [candidate division KSB1 bacterium]|nr:DUF503 domain-containing protein [candidate division KSB1 bacterium]
MLVAVCQIELYLPGSSSLKEKRLVLQSLKTRIRQKFNVSVAEVDGADKWQTAVLGLSMVANERKLLDQAFSKVLSLIESDGRSHVIRHTFEIY